MEPSWWSSFSANAAGTIAGGLVLAVLTGLFIEGAHRAAALTDTQAERQLGLTDWLMRKLFLASYLFFLPGIALLIWRSWQPPTARPAPFWSALVLLGLSVVCGLGWMLAMAFSYAFDIARWLGQGPRLSRPRSPEPHSDAPVPRVRPRLSSSAVGRPRRGRPVRLAGVPRTARLPRDDRPGAVRI